MVLLKKLFLILLSLAGVQSAYALTPEQTKNTALIGDNVEQLFKYGVQIGEVYIETHIIESMARFAPDGAIKDLLNGLFNTTTAHFRIPDYNSIFGYHITPEIIGQIIDLVFKQKKNKSFILSSIQVKKKSKKGFNEFVDKLFLALEEEKDSSFYQKNTVINILYSFLYKKANTKTNLKPYFDALCKNNEFKNSNPTTQVNWTENFTKKELSNAKIEKNTDLAKTIAVGVQQNWIHQEMPKLIEYKTVNSKKHKISFSDCFETTLRNICNILAYYKPIFSKEAITEQVDVELPQALQSFYTKNPENKDSKIIHTVWLDNVLQTNVPYAIYNRLINESNFVKKDGDLYMYIPSTSTLLKDKQANANGFYTIDIHDNKYHVFTEKSKWFGYELEPCTYELIIMLNHILGLNLFKNKKIEDEIIKKDFEQKYTEKLFDALNVDEYKKKHSHNINSYIVTLNENKSFKIKIENGRHAAAKPIKNTDTSKENNLALINKNAIEKNLNNTKTIEQKILFHSFEINNNVNNNEQIFRYDMESNDSKINAIKKISKQNIDKQHEEIIKNIIKTFHLVEEDWSDYKNLIKKINKNTTIKDIIDEEIALLYAEQLENNQTNDNLIREGQKEVPEIYKKALTKKLSGPTKKRILIIEKTDQLHKAITKKDKKTTKCIINTLENINDTEILRKVFENTNKKGYNALQLTLIYDQPEIAKTIINENQTLQEMFENTSNNGYNALQFAIAKEQPNIAKLILKNLNDNGQTLRKVFENTNKEGYNALQIAIIKEQPNIAKLILKNLNDNGQILRKVFENTNKEGYNALQIAIAKEQPDIAKLIIDTLKNLNDNGQTLRKVFENTIHNGYNALQIAIRLEQPNIAETIINELKKLNGNNKTLENTGNCGRNALQVATDEKQKQIAKLIITTLNNINDDGKTLKKVLENKDYRGYNALQIAKRNNLNPIVSMINTIQRCKWIPLITSTTAFTITGLTQKFMRKKNGKESITNGAIAAATAYVTSKTVIDKTKDLPTRKQLALNCALSTTLGTIVAPNLTKYGYKFYKKIQQKWTENKRPITISNKTKTKQTTSHLQ